MEFSNTTAVELGAEDPKVRWARETRAAIAFEEDPHSAALNDDPEMVFAGPRTWAAILALSTSLGAPIGLAVLTIASVSNDVTRELGASEATPWVVGSWSIASACSAALAGYLSDIFGRRNIIITGQLTILIGCIMGGTTQSIQLLLLAQTLIGFGAGFVFDAFAAVPEMLPNRWRALGAGVVEGGINVPWATIAVILANALTRHASWRWIYYIAIFLSFLSFKATAFLYWPVSRPQGDFDNTRWQQIKELDYVGIASVTGGIVLFTSGLTWGGLLFPWSHPGTILTITVGFFTILGGFAYCATLAKHPFIPLNLFRPSMFRRYLAVLIVLFVSGMNFYALTTLLPVGSTLMFTTNELELGLMSLPNTFMELIAGLIIPVFSHKIPDYVPGLTIKWQLVVGMVMQAVFLGLSATSVNPNNKALYMVLPAFGSPMFTMVTVLSYAIASLHVPHSQLGTALGLLGTFRSTGGAIGNACFGALFTRLSEAETSSRVQAACEGLGLCPNMATFERLLVELQAYNQGLSGMLVDISPASRDILQQALRTGYGRTFQIIFCATIPLSVLATLCAWHIEDPWPYMNNHVQFRMYERGGFSLRSPEGPALTGATVVWQATKLYPTSEDYGGTELHRVGSTSSQACLTVETSMNRI